MKTFRRELISLINKHSKENGSDTPDFILAEYLIECLHTFDKITNQREEWYGGKVSDAITLDKAERLASEMNYNNMCARATLYPNVAIEDIPKITAEDLMKPKKK